jgi:hypothetical protein
LKEIKDLENYKNNNSNDDIINNSNISNDIIDNFCVSTDNDKKQIRNENLNKFI